MIRQIKIACLMLLLMTLLTGVLYPLAITGIAQIVFPDKANGGLIRLNGNVVGSDLIGQSFSDPKYFWSRPSATSPFPYNSASSSGSNYGPLNPELLEAVHNRVDQLHAADPSNPQPIPVDLVTASASGLDPHISIAAALYQILRVARARKISEQELRALVDQYTDQRSLGFLGEPGVNVLELNLALDNSPSKGIK
jgi:K+-transporting ATPase ATPase C chain